MKKLVVFLAAFVATVAWADTLTLKPGHPESYVVKKGDTLWDISAVFLDDPWRWPTLWGANPQIANPHLIYPGDQLTLVFLDGQPRLVRKAMVTMSPTMGIQPKGGAIPALPLSIIEPFLSHRQVLTETQLVGVPRVLGGEKQAIGFVSGDVVFVNDSLPLGSRYGIYTQGKALYDSDGKTFLGLELELSATGQISETGRISRLSLLSSKQEVKAGQFVMPISDASMLPAYFMPHAAPAGLSGNIIASEAKTTEIGPLQVAMVNLGKDNGAAPGQVYAVHQPGKEILEDSSDEVEPYRELLGRDAYDRVMARLIDGRTVILPAVYEGEIMLFKTFDKVSLGLIVNGRRPMRVADEIMAPSPMVFGSERD